MSLKDQTISGILWNSIERFGSLGIQLITTIILARLLSPSDFGLIGMLYVFITLGATFIDSGFSQALIREKEVNQTDYSSVFYLNIFLGVIVYIILFFLSSSIAHFFHEDELKKLSKFVFLIFPINSLSLIQIAIINREVTFQKLTKVSILSSIISGIIGIVMAYCGYGVWSLVYQSIFFAFFKSLFLWIVNSWRPSFVFNFDSIKKYFGFSANILATDTIIGVFNNIYTIIIGKFYPLNEVGYYNQAKRFTDVPYLTLTSIVQSVSYPILSKVQEDDEKLKYGYRKVIKEVMYLNLPIMFGLLAVSNNLIFVVFSTKWMPAVPYFQLLCIYGAFFPLHSINVNILKVKGKSNKMLILEIIRRSIIVLAIIFTLKRGIIIMLIGNIFASWISILINMFFCGKEIHLTLKEQFKDIIGYFVLAIIMMISTYFINYLFDIEKIYVLIIQVFMSFCIYFCLSVFLKVDAFEEIKNIILNKIKK